MLDGLDLFSGIGGLSIALQDWVIPVAYCEIDPYCQAIILDRIMAGDLQNAPIWDDIRTLSAAAFQCSQPCDILYGGFPCQDISIAGLGKGLDGERSGLFFEIVRLAKEIKPKFIFLENVPAITLRGADQVVEAITEMGYDCRWCVISAASIGALHRRERWFLLARNVANPMRERCEDWEKKRSSEAEEKSTVREDRDREKIRLWQEAVSTLDRTTDGVPQRVDRIRSLGNAVVPQQAKEAFKILMGLK